LTSRSVITGDNVEIDEVGVPISVAQNIPIPEVVRDYNYNRLMTCFFK